MKQIRSGGARRGRAQRWEQPFPYFVYGTNGNGTQNTIELTADGHKHLDEQAMAIVNKSDEILKDALRKYASEFAYELDGVDISKLSSKNDAIVNIEIGKILASQESKNKVRSNFQKWLKDNPKIAPELLNSCTSDIKAVNDWKTACEKYGNLQEGSLSSGDEDFLFMVDCIAAAYPDEEKQEARRTLLSMTHDSAGRSDIINIYNAFYGNGGKYTDEEYDFGPAKKGENFKSNETRFYKKMKDDNGDERIVKVSDYHNFTGSGDEKKKKEDKNNGGTDAAGAIPIP